MLHMENCQCWWGIQNCALNACLPGSARILNYNSSLKWHWFKVTGMNTRSVAATEEHDPWCTKHLLIKAKCSWAHVFSLLHPYQSKLITAAHQSTQQMCQVCTHGMPAARRYTITATHHPCVKQQHFRSTLNASWLLCQAAHRQINGLNSLPWLCPERHLESTSSEAAYQPVTGYSAPKQERVAHDPKTTVLTCPRKHCTSSPH